MNKFLSYFRDSLIFNYDEDGFNSFNENPNPDPRPRDVYYLGLAEIMEKRLEMDKSTLAQVKDMQKYLRSREDDFGHGDPSIKWLRDTEFDDATMLAGTRSLIDYYKKKAGASK